jgi:hypothetical protein
LRAVIDAQTQPLSQSELDMPADFPASPQFEHRAMELPMLEGFLAGTASCEDEWAELWEEQPALLALLMCLEADEGRAMIREGGQPERWMKPVQPMVVSIHEIWLQASTTPLDSSDEGAFDEGSGRAKAMSAPSLRSAATTPAPATAGRSSSNTAAPGTGPCIDVCRTGAVRSEHAETLKPAGYPGCAGRR